MRKVKEVLRLRFALGLDHRQIAGSCRVSHVTVGKYLSRFAAAGLSWPLPEDIDDGELMHRAAKKDQQTDRISGKKKGPASGLADAGPR